MKYLKKNSRSGGKVILWILIALLVIGLAIGLTAGLLSDDDPPHPSESQTEAQTGATEESTPSSLTDDVDAPPTALSLPYSLEDGKILVESVYQFSGLNPDADDAEVEDVAAIQLQNLSGQHIQSLTLTLTTTAGTSVVFTAQDIPAGCGAMLVSPDNTRLETNPQCAQITCEAVFVPQSPLSADVLSISVDGVQIQLENISGADLPRVTVYCHGMLDSYCYGGTPYVYTTDALPAGETAQIDALECFLGQIQVVRAEAKSD